MSHEDSPLVAEVARGNHLLSEEPQLDEYVRLAELRLHVIATLDVQLAAVTLERDLALATLSKLQADVLKSWRNSRPPEKRKKR